jgi:hypothetical protein
VLDPTLDLGGAPGAVGAVMSRLILFPLQVGTALWALPDKFELRSIIPSLVKVHSHDLRDDLSALLHKDLSPIRISSSLIWSAL